MLNPLADLRPLFLDTETTGLDVHEDEVLSVALLDWDGQVLFNARLRPVERRAWPKAQQVHGITPAEALDPALPTLADVATTLAELTRGRLLVAYNAFFDCVMLGPVMKLGPPAETACAMEAFAELYGEWSEHHGSYRSQSLATAARYVDHRWRGEAHGALADCYALRDVWEYLHSPEKREAVAAARQRRAVRAQERQYVASFLARQQLLAGVTDELLNEAWVAAHQRQLGLRPPAHPALESADVFSLHLTTYPVRVWNAYGAKLKCPRYGPGQKRRQPAHLVRADGGQYHFLRRPWQPADQAQLSHLPGPVIQPAALVEQPHLGPHRFAPLFDLRKLTLGVDYVPIAPYEWPEGHASATTLRKQYKLKARELAALRPAYLRYGKDFGGNRTEYLLYPIPPHLLPVAAPLVTPGPDGYVAAAA